MSLPHITHQILLRECVAPSMDVLTMELQSAPPGVSVVLHKIIQALEGGLSYQYHAAWDLVFGVLTVMFEVSLRSRSIAL